MAIKKDKVDCVVIGFGWTGAILAQELTEAGLDVVALERGAMRDTPTDAEYPKVVDELKYVVRGELFQDLSRETVTIRHGVDDLAVPYRQNGSFLLGNGVGGAGFHWNGMHYRVLPEELQLRSRYVDRYGKKFIPEGMQVQDFGVTYDELEPHFDFAEKVFGTSGTAGNLNGKIQPGGNPLEGHRSSEYPTRR
jgi:gluconate 2-dehydrogenase alpha chain